MAGEAAVDIAAWLGDLGLERYVQTFRDHEIDTEVLSDLTDADLEKLAIPLGHRKKLLRAIAGLSVAEPELSRSPLLISATPRLIYPNAAWPTTAARKTTKTSAKPSSISWRHACTLCTMCL